ncbi:SHOCT domain-containing protein [Isoptericola sp. b441]|uniref:SHOCT domain-containing protein n=1 Tax=Actinotalea lenta TaxID=3064654 RepID=A0ABT9DBR6_9CELL|nr:MULTISPECIES: SHOCT domain-containing protein [unclassified Isoptericola]MDO8107633.1 SHOCT domain-containing protein [Isoptericola sp. b441]MDO8120707.1 SHOCT domain-containing protein [Isoptericola sp. b490]
MMGMYGGMGGAGWLGMGLFWLVLIGLVVWLVIRLLPERGHRSDAPTPPPPTGASTPSGSALEVLDQRLARGEVDVETYRSTRAAILDARGGGR